MSEKQVNYGGYTCRLEIQTGLQKGNEKRTGVFIYMYVSIYWWKNEGNLKKQTDQIIERLTLQNTKRKKIQTIQ